MKRLTDKSFRYHDSEETRKPGYLARRMAHYRAQLKAPKPSAEVRTLDTRRKQG